jgi:hypothetical protein
VVIVVLGWWIVIGPASLPLLGDGLPRGARWTDQSAVRPMTSYAVRGVPDLAHDGLGLHLAVKVLHLLHED